MKTVFFFNKERKCDFCTWVHTHTHSKIAQW